MERFERYVPEKELPEEIQNMPCEETKCRFCGVSYLVHHEVARLEDVVKKMQEEKDALLCRLTDAEENRKLMKKEVEREQNNSKELTKRLQILKDRENGILQREKQYYSILRQFHHSVKQIQAVVPLMKTTLANSMLDDHQSCSAAIIQSTKNSVTSWLKEKCLLKERIAEADRINIEATKQLVKERETSASTAAQVLELRKQLMSAEGKYTTLNDELKCINDKLHTMTTSKENQIRSLQVKLERSLEQCSSLTREVETLSRNLKSKSAELLSTTERYELDRAALDKQLMSQERELIHCKAQLTKEKQDVLSKLSLAEIKLSQLSQQQDMLTAQHHLELEKALDSMKLRNQEKLAQLRKTLLQESEKILFIERSKHKSSLEQQHKSHHLELTELEVKISSLKKNQTTEIEKLKTELLKEQQMFDVEVTRHIEEKKNLTMELERLAVERDQQEMTVQQELDKCRKEISAQLEEKERAFLEWEERCTILSEKVKSAYLEISSLQSTVERQCLERRELLSQRT